MKFVVPLAALLAAAAGAGALRSGSEASKNHPVSKVVTLLQDMKQQLEDEGEADEDAYDKLACWCETNDKSKTKAIADAEAHLSDLGSEIEQLTATSARLNVEIKNLEEEVAKNVKALDVATALRAKQLEEFTAEEKEMLSSINALGDAVIVLSKHHTGAAASAALASVKKLIQKNMQLIKVFQATTSPHDRRIVEAFVQGTEGGGPTKAYAPASGQIFGILKQMKENFEGNLAQSQVEEKQNKVQFEDLKEAKEAEIEAGQGSLKEKKQNLANTDEKCAIAKEDRDDTNESLNADQTFLTELKVKCALTDEEWKKRQEMRQEEIVAVAKAIEILASDDARDTFNKSFNADSFLQEQRSMQSDLRNRAADAIMAVASRLPIHNTAMVKLAGEVRLDAFTKVKKAIDDMVKILIQEKADEIEHRDMCTTDLNGNVRVTEKELHSKRNLQSKIDGLKQTIKELDEALAMFKSEIADLELQLSRAKEDRDAENKEYQVTISDQHATQGLLHKAIDVLKGVYAFPQQGKRAVKHSQVAKHGQAPPPDFKEYEKHGGSTGIIALMSQILHDAEEMEAEAKHDEKEAQLSFEAFQQKTKDAVKAKQDAITNKTEEKSQADEDLLATKSEFDDTMVTLEDLSKTKGDLHVSCDYVLKNFETRQTARDEEVDALRQAKAILSGMKM